MAAAKPPREVFVIIDSDGDIREAYPTHDRAEQVRAYWKWEAVVRYVPAPPKKRSKRDARAK
jgi:hypothetical protein